MSSAKKAGRYELIPIDSLVPYPGNARTHSAEQIEMLRASLREFGFVSPVLVDGERNIIAGHGRVMAAKDEGMTEVPCVYVDGLTDEQRRAYIIADNRLAEHAGWDVEMLKLELEELEIAGFDISLTGWSDIDDLDSEWPDIRKTEDDGFDSDAALEETKEPFTKRGWIWQLGQHRLMCGDSTVPEDMRRLFDGSVARMCITDPPWNVAIGLDNNPVHRQREGLINDNLSSDDFKAFLDGFVRTVAPYLDGDMYCCLGASEWPRLDVAMRDNGFHWSGTIIWVKDTFVMGRSNYHRRYEPIWYGWKSGKTSSFNGERNLDDVWEFKRPRVSEEHPTMKPIELWGEAILNSSKPGDVIVDPFGGSGTAIIAAEQLGRKALSMELDPKYCDVIVKRWEALTGGKANKL